MAERKCAKEVFVGLGLKEADASVELVGYRDLLVVLWEGADEGRVVGSNGSDVGVLAIAELRVAVARCLC